MRAERLSILLKVLPRWEIDINTGTVKTVKGISNTVDRNGYGRVGASYKGKYYSFGLHEVIAVAGGLDILDKQVNHIDGNKLNNSISNLEAVTISENIQHSFNLGLNKGHKGSEHGRALLTDEQVIEIKKALKDYKHGLGKELADRYGVKKATISAIRNGRLWSHITIQEEL